ncbi:staygreen family protein [Sporosarcina sp. HYO08]|uniref:staygreen family protein n=1 Tax=Sporosarcina sp. HYO08 TaxID=1759557 RepID=UPI0020A31CF3|nr:staygreen family protein [Sporosarcina sp. HYO08]
MKSSFLHRHHFHSDVTGELFLTTGMNYAWEKTNPTRDEVLAEWKANRDSYLFYVYLYVNPGQFTPSVTAKRNEVFRRELPLALQAIRYGDRAFFEAHPQLEQAPIIVTFISADPQFARQEYWGTFQSITSSS